MHDSPSILRHAVKRARSRPSQIPGALNTQALTHQKTCPLAAGTSMDRVLARLGDFREEPLDGASPYVKPASIKYQIDGARSGRRSAACRTAEMTLGVRATLSCERVGAPAFASGVRGLDACRRVLNHQLP